MKVPLTLQIIIVLLGFFNATESKLAITTCDRITQHGYPCENHTVTTKDGYVLTMFRIPHSPKGDDPNLNTEKPAVLMMHCLLCSSDIWVINGPDNSLAFMLANAGYDVWIGNARGNIYSAKHGSLSTWSQEFWDFSLDEISQYDLPAKIDYILAETGQRSLHYVGYSQGTAVFMMLLSKQPSYNQKIRTAHLLGPVVFVCHMRSPVPVMAAQIMGRPFFSPYALMSSQTINGLLRSVSPWICEHPLFESLCVMVLNFVTGWDSPYLNRTLLSDFLTTTPADGSNRQIVQFYQFKMSCELKAYDFGIQGNMHHYGKPHPPFYNLHNVKLQTPINVYYSDNDYFVSLKDVQHLSNILGDRVALHRVKYPKFNHFDFALAINTKEVINLCVIDKMERYEGRPFNGSLCNSFKNKPFQ